MSTLGQRIKELRDEREMSQEQLAALVGVSQSKISHCETGTRGISFELAVKIAHALGVKVDELIPTSVEIA